MPENKKILITLDADLLADIDIYAKNNSVSRSEFIRQAIKEYINEKRRKNLRESLKKGYLEMADINVGIAEMCFDADNDTHFNYEEKLSESEDS